MNGIRAGAMHLNSQLHVCGAGLSDECAVCYYTADEQQARDFAANILKHGEAFVEEVNKHLGVIREALQMEQNDDQPVGTTD